MGVWNDINIGLKTMVIQRVGPRFCSYMSKFNQQHIHPVSNAEESEDFDDNEQIDVDIEFLQSLNPKEWKDQDHYAVLGLKHLRYKASEDAIRRAFRKMVLKHHPDKRKAVGEEINTEDDYFTCITKAYEILGTPKLRTSYDSVDPEFDDSLPTQSEVDSDYIKAFTKAFELNSRWSEKKNVPSFGDENSSRNHVDNFYQFWYDFESWREFSYLDEEDKDKGQDREERRWIEKQNKISRIKLKKEEMARIRSLVDLAYNNDKRISKFKQEEKDRKLALKRAKMDAAQAQRDQEERMLREAQLAKERAEKAEQKRIEQIRYEREQLKKAMKKEKKILRDYAKEKKYFSSGDKDLIKNMEGVEIICDSLNLQEFQKFNKELTKIGPSVFFSKLKELDKKNKEEKMEIQEKKVATPNGTLNVKPVNKNVIWDNDNVQLLIKAVNLFPSGTAQRWEVIASFINQHSLNEVKHVYTAKEVLNKAKTLQQADFSKSTYKMHVNNNAFESFEKSKKDIKADTQNGGISYNESKVHLPLNPIQQNGIKTSDDEDSPKNIENIATNDNVKGWTPSEQALLEQAIKTYPIATADRWERIAECIPNRNKKDCIKRVKELVELVNSKKGAQQLIK